MTTLTDGTVVSDQEATPGSPLGAANAGVEEFDMSTPAQPSAGEDPLLQQGAADNAGATSSKTRASSKKREASQELVRDRRPTQLEIEEKEKLAEVIRTMQQTMTKLQQDMEELRKENEKLKADAVTNVVKESDPKRRNDPMKPLDDIDKKDVEKPGKYKSDPMQWRIWLNKMKNFLARRDLRWPKIIDAIQAKSKEPLKEGDEREIFKQLNIDVDDDNGKALADKFRDQFTEYLDNFTEGSTRALVQSTGSEGVWETFRQMCDEGHSKRERHLKKEYRVVSNPKQATFENLRQAIAGWEKDLADYETAADHRMDDRTRLLCLEDICPDILQQHLASKDELKTYAGYKAVINDYLIERRRWTSPTSKGKINWLGVQEKAEEPNDEGVYDETENPEAEVENFMSEVKATIMALVKNKFGKKGKGKGKGAGKDDGGKSGDKGTGDNDPKCFECGESMAKCGHSARDCPVRKARIAAGGPERLPKGKGKGKQGKGEGWPTRTMWNNFYPGPSQTQWRGWYPQQQPQPPTGKLNLFEQPMQLSAVSPLQALLTSPGGLYNISPKKQVKNKPMQTFEHVNKFGVLAESEDKKINDDGVKMKVNLMDAVKRTSLNQQKKAAKTERNLQRGAGPDLGPTQMTRHNDPSGSGARSRVPTDEAVQPKPTGRHDAEKSLLQDMLDFVNKPLTASQGCCKRLNPRKSNESLNVVSTTKSVSSMGGNFEVLSSIVDSGATIPTMHPEDAKAYDLLESEGSRNGVEYEVANCETIPNVGEKKFAVLTAEGTLRGYQTQCAEVGKGKPLQAVRALVSSSHAVCFGLGERGEDHVIINKTSGEVNHLRDDGINYLQDLLVIPQDKILEVQQRLLMIQADNDGNGPDFGGQGR